MFARRCALFAAILAITSGPAGAINPLDGLTVTDTQSNLQPGNLTGTNNGLNNTNTGVINQLGVGNGVTFTGTGNAGLLNSGRINSQGGTQSILTSATSVIYGANAGISNAAAGTISSTALDSLRNNGTIGQSGLLLSTNGLYNAGTITNATSNRSIYNFGTITGSNAGIYNDTGGVIQNTNNGGSIANPTGGTIGGSSTTYGILNNGTIFANTGTAIQNTGTMTGSTAGIYNGTGGVIRSNSIFYVVQNVGTIGGAGSQYGIYNAGTMSNNGGASTIITNQNRGTISGTVAGIYNAAGASMTQTGAGSAAIFNDNGSTINSITNLGSMTGPLAAIFNSSASGVITTLNNAQGQASALTYRGRLPVNYNVIVNSPTDYGKLQISSPAATTNFGVSALSTLTTATYTAVLSGINSTYLANQVGGTVTGTLGAYSWTLQAESGSPTIWDLIVTCSGGCGGGGSTSAPAPAPATLTDIATGGTFGLSSIGVTTNPVFDGGTLSLTAGASTSQPFTVTALGGTIATPSGGTASMSGGLSGSGSMTINGGGTLQLSGLNTYTGGTTIDGNTVVSIAGSNPLGSGAVFVASGSALSGSGTIGAPVTVSGTLHPGNSPGYLALTRPLTFNTGGTYQQDIAGPAQASASSPVGATGYYSFTQVTGAGVTINPGATLAPRLQNLFTPSESGYGSAPFVPSVGDKFRILTADGGITGKFTLVTQPEGMASGTQFLQFYNFNGSNSIDLAVAPSSYATASSGNRNARAVGSALDKMVVANQTGQSTGTQDALLYPVSGQSMATLGSYLQGMSGEIYGATLAVVPQTTQRLQAAVLSRLGDSTFVATRGMAQVTPASNSSISASNPGGQPTASMSSNPNVNPYATSGAGSMRNGAAWGEIAYQYGNRSSDSNSGGWSSNLVQAVVGLDAYSQGGTRAGGGLALSNTNVTATQGSGTVQQGTLFLYGKMPVQQVVVDAMASYGFNSTNNSRNDPTGITGGQQAKNVQGNDALLSAGVSLPIESGQTTFAPYARVTWQNLTQNGFNEGSAASALTVNSYNGNGVRGVIGLTAGSKATDPIREQYTYKANVGVGVDSNAVMSPTLKASIAGQGTQIYTPNPSAAFVQVGVYGTAKLADSAYAYAGVTSELRGGQALVGGNVGVLIQF